MPGHDEPFDPTGGFVPPPFSPPFGRALTAGERKSFGGALSVMELFEAVVTLGSLPEHLTHLLRQAEALVRGLSPERTEEGLGPICELDHYAALAWCISHCDDGVYREAYAAAGPPSQPPTYEHPFHQFSHYLRLYLRGMPAHGREGHYRMHGWLGDKGVDLDPGWFVEGNMRFDALANAVEMADGRRYTGIEARLVLEETEAIDSPSADDLDDDGAEDQDEGEPEAPTPSEAQLAIRQLERAAWAEPGSPKLRQRALSNSLYKEGLDPRTGRATHSKHALEEMFKIEVPPDRRLGRGEKK